MASCSYFMLHTDIRMHTLWHPTCRYMSLQVAVSQQSTMLDIRPPLRSMSLVSAVQCCLWLSSMFIGSCRIVNSVYMKYFSALKYRHDIPQDINSSVEQCNYFVQCQVIIIKWKYCSEMQIEANNKIHLWNRIMMMKFICNLNSASILYLVRSQKRWAHASEHLAHSSEASQSSLKPSTSGLQVRHATRWTRVSHLMRTT